MLMCAHSHLKTQMTTSGATEIPITANRKEISHEIKLLMGNGGLWAAFHRPA